MYCKFKIMYYLCIKKQEQRRSSNPLNLSIMDLSVLKNIKVNENFKVREYVLSYYVGVWETTKRIYAESEEEAIYDAIEYLKEERCDRLDYCLFLGNKKIMGFPAPSKDRFITLVGLSLFDSNTPICTNIK